MSDNKILPVAIVSFLAGAFVGSIIALLYAPKSGEELRGQIRSEADATVKRASAEWNKAVQQIQEQIEAGQVQIQNYMAQLQVKPEEAKPAEQPPAAE